MTTARSMLSPLLALFLVAAACGDDGGDPRSLEPDDRFGGEVPVDAADASTLAEDAGGDAGGADAGEVEVDAERDAGPLEALMVPRPWPEEARLTNDVDRDLEALLEHDALEGSCEAYAAGQRDELTMMRCGKWLFFYESFGTVGVPTVLLEFLQAYYADTYYGDGFAAMGMVPDPYSSRGMPLGLARSSADGMASHAFTCASCHFGQLPDGRYAVGYGNMEFDYGGLVASLGAPLSMSLNENSNEVHDSVRAELLEPVRAAKQQSGYMTSVATVGLQLLGADTNGRIDVETQGLYNALRPGTMDFLAPPVLVNDDIWTVSRILPLWNLPDEQMRAEYAMDDEMLSWTGISPSLETFVEGFVMLGVSDDAWPPERVAPLTAYIRSLRVPPLEVHPDAAAVERGAAIFAQDGCAECHNGPSGEGTRLFDFEEVQTDEQMRWIYNPDPDGNCTFVDQGLGPDCVVTGKLKAPRLVAMQQQSKLLHNGSVDSLEQLLCLEARPVDVNAGQGSQGHEFGCDTLTEAQRVDLIAYLETL